MNLKMKKHILENWDKYNLVNTKEDMLALLNILEAHKETLDSLHDVIMGNSQWVCSIFFYPIPATDKEVVNGIMMHNSFYKTKDALMEIEKENAEYE
jgi:hypothetical protein